MNVHIILFLSDTSLGTLIFYLLYWWKNKTFARPVAILCEDPFLCLIRQVLVYEPTCRHGIQYPSAYLLLKRFVKCTSGYSQHFIFLPFQVAFNTKQKPIRGWELSLAHCVSMVTGLYCSSSEFSPNDLRCLCDLCLLNLDYYVPSALASYLYTTIASKGGSLPTLWLKHLNTNTTLSVFLTSHDKVHTKITGPFSSYALRKVTSF